jgi:Protein of unknown function (DUF3572)
MRETNKDDPAIIGIQMVGWIVSDPVRADRFLALTGLDGAAIRARITDPSLLDAAFGFLEGHQSDFIACADALGLSPERLAAVRGDIFQ